MSYQGDRGDENDGQAESMPLWDGAPWEYNPAKPVIAIDIDNTIAACWRGVGLIAKQYGLAIPAPADWEYSNFAPEARELTNALFRDVRFYEGLEPILGVKPALYRLAETYSLSGFTARAYSAELQRQNQLIKNATMRWLQIWDLPIDVVWFTSLEDKVKAIRRYEPSAVAVIDDSAAVCKEAAAAGYRAYLVDMTYNEAEPDEGNLKRVYSLAEVARLEAQVTGKV